MNRKQKTKTIAMALCVALLFQVADPIKFSALVDEEIQEQSTEEVQEESSAADNETATMEESSSSEETRSDEESSSLEETKSDEESSSSEEASEGVESSTVTEESSAVEETVFDEMSEVEETESETETEEESELAKLGAEEAGEPDVEGFAEAVLEGMKNKVDVVENLEKYKVPKEMVSDIFISVVDQNPDLYYVKNRLTAMIINYVSSITFHYYTNATDDNTYWETRQKALNSLTSDMSDLQKALVLHNWLITHIDYDHNAFENNLFDESHSAYNVFVKKSAVCQGIALAYKSLLDEIGIENYIVEGMAYAGKHMWNVIVIDGNYYHIDVTFDNVDKSDSKFPSINYNNFLTSNNHGYFNYTHYDYYMYKDYQKMDVPATSATYDNAFWQYVTSSITAANGSFYYIKNNKLYKTTSYDDSALSIEIAELNAISKSSVSYSGLFRMNDRIYFNDKYAVYSIALDGTDKRAEYQITDTTNGYISAVDRTGDQVYIELYKDDTFAKSDISLAGGSIELQPMEIGFENSEEEMYENDTLQLSVKAYPGGEISNVTWTSDNTAVATVSSSGLVTPVATGTAKITAEWNSMKAECTITVKENTSPAEQHYVIFREPNGDFITSCYVDDGCDAPLPDYSAPDGYSLSWTENYINVRQNETVTAIFTPIEYNITYELNGGTNNTGNPAKYTIETDDITLASPTKDGATFDGWYYDNSFVTKVDVISKGSYGDITLYAKWTAESSNKYLITFKAPDGTVLKEEQVTEGHDATLPEYSAPNGYKVTWNGNYTNVRQDETITAVLTPIEYNITYELDGGTNTTTNPSKYTIETDNIVLASPTKDGMIFDGWYYESSFVTKIDMISKGSYGDITLYAKWFGKDPEDNPEYKNGLWTEKINDVYYTGSTIKPVPVVYDGRTKLASGKDYSIAYKNNTNAGTAQVIITGKGNYKGKVTAEFKIIPVDIKTASVYDMSVMYKSGKRQTPVPVVELNGKKLKNKKDFSVSYQDGCTEPGEYDVTVSGTGNYTGTRQIKLVIASGNEILISKASVSKISDVTYTGNPVVVDESSITVKYKGKALEKGTDYEIQYGSYIDSGTYDLLIVGKGQYRGVKTVKFNIKGTAIKKAAMTPLTVSYTGTPQIPDIKLTFEGKSLVYGTDYVTVFENNVNKGKAKVKITGMGRFSGTVTKTFNITTQPISATEISLNNNSFPYVKGGTIPEITVKCNGNVLRKGVDYTVTGKNNQKVGNATLVVKGIRNYSGTVNKSFTITTQDISNVLLMVPDVEFTGRKGGYVTKPVLMDTSGKTLSSGSDYDKNIVYKDASGNVLDKNSVVNVGNVISVTIKGKGNYSGEITGTYRIIPKGRSIAKAKQNKIVKEYTGEQVVLSKEDISLSIGGSKIPSDGFEIIPGSYVNNINKGTANVTVRGIGEYGGIKTITFKIDMQNLKWGK